MRGLCEDDLRSCHFREYGVTDHEGRHRLKGPGLGPGVGEGGVSHMGGKWPARLAIICQEISGVFQDSEMELYNQWREQDQAQLVKFLCLDEER